MVGASGIPDVLGGQPIAAGGLWEMGRGRRGWEAAR